MNDVMLIAGLAVSWFGWFVFVFLIYFLTISYTRKN